MRMTRLAIIATLGCSAVFAQEVAFTWDDLPSHSALPKGETRAHIAQQIIEAMKAAGMPPVYGFVNGASAEKEPMAAPVLESWRNAGLQLGNHAWSHMNLNTSELADWEADVLKNEPLLSAIMGSADWHRLRFPFLAEGDTPEKRDAARRFLAEHHYKIAAVTMGFNDWMYNEPYARCVAKHDTAGIAQLEASYLAAARADIGYRRAMAKELFGHDIPYVLLLHIGALDARLLPKLIDIYREAGFHFVTLEQAEKDPFYRNDLDPSLPAVPDSLEEAIKVRNLTVPEHAAADMNVVNYCK